MRRTITQSREEKTHRKRRWCADCTVLTAAVSAGTDHRPFWCSLADGPFGIIAVYMVTTGCDFSTEESDLLRVSVDSQWEAALRESQRETLGKAWAQEGMRPHDCWLHEPTHDELSTLTLETRPGNAQHRWIGIFKAVTWKLLKEHPEASVRVGLKLLVQLDASLLYI